MPFGAKNAGATYSRFIDMLIRKWRSPYLLAYVDDVIVHTPDMDFHLLEIEKALQMHQEAGIKLNAPKTHLFTRGADYLGHRVDKDGIHMQDEYVERIRGWPVPKTVKQLASFLGFTGYYRSFIKEYAQLTAEMNSQKKKKVLEWTPEMGQKFEMLKELFCRKPIRAYPRFGEDEAMFAVNPDWCIDAIGAILEQEQDGQVRFIAAAGRKTTPGECNYPPTKGELSAIIYALRKFEHILRYKKFVIYCDHKPLQWLQTMKNPKGIYWRWLAGLATYDFEVRYKPGSQIGAADGLSRSPHMRDPTPEEVEESEEFVGQVESEAEGSDEPLLGKEHLQRAQLEDEVLRLVKKWTRDPPKGKEELRGLPEDAIVYSRLLKSIEENEEGILVRKGSREGQDDRILVPNTQQMQNEVFYWSHEHPTAGHFGCNATTLRAFQKFYWPGMNEFLKRRIKNCNVCLAKIQKTSLHDTVHRPRRHGYPGEVLYVDLVGPMPETLKGDKYITTMMDGFTKYATAVTIPNKEAITVANAVIEGWVTKFGCPARIHTDQGKEFVNGIWEQLMDRLQIQKTTTPAYSPQGNLVERFHRSLNQIMRIYMNREDKSWDRYVSTACLAYNTKVNSTTGVTPHEAWTGRAAKLPIDLIVPLPTRSYNNEDSYITDTLRRFEVMYAAMRKKAEDTFRRNAKLYSGKCEEYAVGDLVWVYSKRRVAGKPPKITDAWMGPYKVVGHPTEVNLQVKPAETAGRVQTVHVTTVKRFHPTGCTGLKYRPPREPVELDEEDELAEELGGAPRTMEPPDQMRTGVPIRYADDGAEEEMVEFPARAAESGAEAGTPSGAGPRTGLESGAESDMGTADGAGPLVGGTGAPDSRPPPNPPVKRAVSHRSSDGSSDDAGLPARRQRPRRGSNPSGAGRSIGSGTPMSRPMPCRPEKREAPYGPSEDTTDDMDQTVRRKPRKGRKQEDQPEPEPGGSGRPVRSTRWQVLTAPRKTDHGPYRPTVPGTDESMSSDEGLNVIEAGASTTDENQLTILVPDDAKLPLGKMGYWECAASQSLTLQPDRTAPVGIGLRMALPPGWSMLLLSQPRLAEQDVTVCPSVVTTGNQELIKVLLQNRSHLPRRIQKGERICRALFFRIPDVEWERISVLPHHEGRSHTAMVGTDEPPP